MNPGDRVPGPEPAVAGHHVPGSGHGDLPQLSSFRNSIVALSNHVGPNGADGELTSFFTVSR